MNPSVYLSYHAVNAKQCLTLAAYLKENGYAVKFVPEDDVVADKTPAHILQDLVKTYYDPSDVLVCILGPEAAGSLHVDAELHHALSGKPEVRKGIVLLLLERPDISLDKLRAGNPKALAAIPERLRKQLGYVELANYSRYRDLPALMQAAWKQARDGSSKVDAGAPPASLKKGRYHDQ